MRRHDKSSLIVIGALLMLMNSLAISGQSSGGGFTITSHVAAGGGCGPDGSGRCIPSIGSGSLVLNGTAAEPGAADPSSQTPYSLGGGFWQPEAALPVLLYSIGGHLTYANGVTAGKNVTMTLTGPSGFTPVVTTTDSSGNYSFGNVPAGGNYTVTPSKTGDVNGVTAFDASLAARFAALLISLTVNQQTAADASNNGSVSAFDASLIARTAASIPNTGIAGTWKFSPASLTFSPLSADQVNQNLTAILVGDVSGNWMPAGPAALGPLSTTTTITVSLPNKQDPSGGPSTIPVSVGDMTGQGVFAYAFDLTFNQAVLQPQATPFDTNGTLSSGLSVTANSSTPGHLLINVFSSSSEISGQGVLLNLKFNVIGAPAATSPLTWVGFDFNEGDPADNSISGQFTAAGPTAAPARISGQILNAEGQPVSGATITVTGAKLIRAITNSNGYYKVENLETGAFYTVTPSRANYVFAPANRSFSLLADKTDAVFTAASTGDNANPIDTAEYFVRQQYLDILGREPDGIGFNYWSDQILGCGGDVDCKRSQREGVAAAFFIEREYQASGSYIYGMYSGALGRRPQFAEFSADRTRVVGGSTLEAAKTLFAESFVQRAEFMTKYQSNSTAESFVDALLANVQAAGGDLSGQRDGLISSYNTGASLDKSRAVVLRAIADDAAFKQAKYNEAFVLTEYFSYLRRNPDHDGYHFWVNVLNFGDQGNYRGMVCSFITSREYQLRFSSVVSHSNAECGP